MTIGVLEFSEVVPIHKEWKGSMFDEIKPEMATYEVRPSFVVVISNHSVGMRWKFGSKLLEEGYLVSIYKQRNMKEC